MKTETVTQHNVKAGRLYKGSILIDNDKLVYCKVFAHDYNSDEEAEANAKGIATAINNYDSLLSALKDYYLHLQIESNKSMRVAIETDSKRAELRNLISHVTGEDCEDIQNKCEEEAIKAAEQ